MTPPKRPAAAKNVDEAISLIDGICRISLECDGPEIERYHLKILRAILSGDETLQSLDKKAAVVNQERRQRVDALPRFLPRSWREAIVRILYDVPDIL